MRKAESWVPPQIDSQSVLYWDRKWFVHFKIWKALDETANVLILPDVPHRTPTLIAWINHLHAVSWHNSWKGPRQRTRAEEPPQGGPRTTTQRSTDLEASPPTPGKQSPAPAGARRPCSRARQALATTSPVRLPAAKKRQSCPPARPHRRQPTGLPPGLSRQEHWSGLPLLRKRLPSKGMIAHVSGPTSPTGEQTPEVRGTTLKSLNCRSPS